jgi:hydroxypyruvate isomerase
VENLIYAGKAAGRKNMSILIEPMNPRNAPDYFLRTVEQASELAGKTKLDNVKIMFDCYHVQINQGDVLKRFERHLPLIGHVQFASVPDRGEPDRGELDYSWLLPQLMKLGYKGCFGAEYLPRSQNSEHPTSEGLGWLKKLF